MELVHDVLGSSLSFGAPAADAAQAEAEKLAFRIKRLVRRRTGGSVQTLQVEVLADRVILSGRCSTFYCKQLAQHAAMELAADLVIDNQLEVRQLKR